MKCITRIIVAVALVVLCALGAMAQTSNGTIAGVVTDSTGAAIVNARVTATSAQTGEVRTTTTNAVGAYRFESVLPGSYLLEATADSFSVTKLSSVQVGASIVTSVNIQLKPGKTSETIEVTAQAEQLQTESGEISSTISTTEVQNLPISSLNPYALAATLPGVTTGVSTDFTNGTNFSVNGNRSRANNFLIEGQDNNDAGIAGQGLQPLNLDAIQEVSVMTNSYSAEFGHGGGSVSNLIYKSGTNNFHGAAWELHNSSALEANDHYNNNPEHPQAKAPYHENIFGFDLGGPVVKDKLFFFTSYQWDKYRSAATLGHLWAPTEAGMATLQSEAVTDVQKAQLSYLTQMLSGIRGVNQTKNVAMGTDAEGNARPDVEIGWVQRSGIGANYESPEFDAKGDYLITPSDTLNLRYIKSNFTAPYDIWNWDAQFPGFDAAQNGASHNAGITYTHVFTPKLLNELRMSYGRIGFFFNWQDATLNNPLVDNGNLPALCITNLTCIGPPDGGPQGRFHNTYQLQDSLSWIVGNHSFKFGFDIADIRVADQVPVNWFGTINYVDTQWLNPDTEKKELTGTGLANFLDAMSGSGSVQKTYGSRFVHAPLKSQNYFVQDSWKVRSNFTLSYGLRYEYNAPSAANNMAYPAIDMANPFPANYPVRIKQQGDKNDWSPRLGIAYTPRFWQGLFGQDKTVIRAGAGIFYDGIFTNILDNNQSGAPNTVPATVAFPVNADNLRGSSNFTWANVSPMLNPVLDPYSTVLSIPYNLKNPRTYQWNLNIQRELPGSFLAQVGYVGTRGTHLYGQDELNPLDPNRIYEECSPGYYCRMNPDRGRIAVRDNSGDSIYHALQTELDRRMTKGLMFRAAYTWSKTIDSGSEIYTSDNYSSFPLVQGQPHGLYDRGLSAQDRRHRLALSYVYTVPQLKDIGSFLGTIVNGWELAGTTVFQSGAPGNVELGYDWNYDGIGNDRPMMGNPNAPLTSWGVMEGGQICDGAAWWNTYDPCHPVSAESVHWIAAPFFTQADKPVGRNSYTTPGRQDWTFSITKSIKLGENGQKLEWRTEMFNPFNHSNTGVPNLTLGDGAVTSQYYDGGTNLFGNLADSISGYRQIRMWLKVSF